MTQRLRLIGLLAAAAAICAAADSMRTAQAAGFGAVLVDVTVGQRISRFVGGNWQWLWAAVPAPVAGWAWKRRSMHASAGERSNAGT